MNPLADVPDPEFDLYLNTVDSAVTRALDGFVQLGFEELWYGVDRAQAAADDGESWAPALVDAYRTAADRYALNYGEKLLG